MQVAWLVACCMLFVLPLQGLSMAVASLLGPVHLHVARGAGAIAADEPSPMTDWQDFRRIDHVNDSAVHVHASSTSQAAGEHAHAHAGLGRHHHAAGDASVQVLGADDHGDSPGDHSAAAEPGLVFVAAEEPWLPAAARSTSMDWPVSAASRIAGCDGRRLDRPPKA